MSHQPEIPTRYVCENCQSVYVGTAHRESGNYRYTPPDECAACESDVFVELAQWVRVDPSHSKT
jgi:hypothetical protein